MSIVSDEIKRLNIDEKIKNILFIDNNEKLSIEWGMNYITFSPSKRVRPLLVLESNLIYGDIDADAYILAAAVELVHTYSLVHDDLPCMDNDDLRRGIKTLHTLKSEAYAVLVGDALLTRVLDILSLYSKCDKLPEILSLFHKKSGYEGMILGQILDMDAENKNSTIEEINKINLNKTARLLQLSLMLGAINAGVCDTELSVMSHVGELVGHIFQIKDDILDIDGDTATLGKNTGSDADNNKSSIPLVIGVDNANKLIMQYQSQLIDVISQLPRNKDFFYKFVDFLVTREK